MMRCVGLTNGSGMCRMSTSLGVRPRSSGSASIAASRRRNLPLATRTRHRSRVVRTPQCNHDLSPARTAADRQPRHRAYRMGAMLLGMGVLHFVAPKPFDSIVPAELPGSPRFYTYASGVGGAGHRRAAAGAAHPPAGRACRGGAVRVGVSGQRQHGPAVAGQAVADADRRDRAAAAADSDDHRRRSRSIATPRLPARPAGRPVRRRRAGCPGRPSARRARSGTPRAPTTTGQPCNAAHASRYTAS